jgi:ribonuclease P protein subunit RPR2
MFKHDKTTSTNQTGIYVKNTPKPLNAKQIAQQRIDILFEQANLICKTNPALATKYIQTARKIAMSARYPLPQKYKRHICKHCKTLFVIGFNCRVRIQQKRTPHVVATCLNCGYNSRIPIKRKKQIRKKERAKIEQTPNIPHETPR